MILPSQAILLIASAATIAAAPRVVDSNTVVGVSVGGIIAIVSITWKVAGYVHKLKQELAAQKRALAAQERELADLKRMYDRRGRSS